MIVSNIDKYFKEMDIDISWYKKSFIPNTQLSSKSLDDIAISVENCVKCELSKTRKRTVFGDGSPNSKIMIIGEAPGKEEDEKGKPFIGRAGKLLDSILKSINLNRDLVYITNTIKCRPPENRNPMNEEIQSCAEFLDKQIKIIKPKVLVLLGKIAANNLLAIDKPMAELRQKKFFIERFDVPILVFYHPAYILRSPLKKSQVWEDLKYLKNIIKEHVS
tara:strand:+ start:345 stop:1001 length:657 start_codon:yes stop_codon:yes gene_type:complete